MISISKAVSVLSCAFLLCLGLSNLAQANEAMSSADAVKKGPCEVPHGQTAQRAEQDQMQGGHMISGEVMRMEGTNYFLKDQSGKEVSLQTDQATEKPDITQGDHISAFINDQNRALWIRSNKMTDRRTEHAAADCIPN
jgi:hypothetical protein